MKKTLLFLVALLSSTLLSAQDLQLHYDFVRAAQAETPYFTSTVEYLGVSDKGTTYFFIDMDYSGQQDGVSLLYWEISRDQKIGNLPVNLHFEFTSGNVIAGGAGFPISRSYILGVSKDFLIGNFFFSGALLYRQFEYTKKPNYQFTGVWSANYFNDKFTFDGFIDIWTEEVPSSGNRTIKVLTEPQFWYNFNKTFSLGSEIEISRNFLNFDNKFHALPTFAVKVNL